MSAPLSRQPADPTAHGIAQALGWFSIGLGVLEILAPRKMARTLGMPRARGVLAGYGVREIASGVGLLWAKDRRPWIWSRVGGDALDVATLATGLSRRNPQRGASGLAMAMVLGVTALDIFCAARLSAAPGRSAPVRDYSAAFGMAAWSDHGTRGRQRFPDATRHAGPAGIAASERGQRPVRLIACRRDAGGGNARERGCRDVKSRGPALPRLRAVRHDWRVVPRLRDPFAS